jgi:hypothetical protein
MTNDHVPIARHSAEVTQQFMTSSAGCTILSREAFLSLTVRLTLMTVDRESFRLGTDSPILQEWLCSTMKRSRFVKPQRGKELGSSSCQTPGQHTTGYSVVTTTTTTTTTKPISNMSEDYGIVSSLLDETTKATTGAQLQNNSFDAANVENFIGDLEQLVVRKPSKWEQMRRTEVMEHAAMMQGKTIEEIVQQQHVAECGNRQVTLSESEQDCSPTREYNTRSGGGLCWHHWPSLNQGNIIDDERVRISTFVRKPQKGALTQSLRLFCVWIVVLFAALWVSHVLGSSKVMQT